MAGETIRFPANGHSTPGYLARPDGGRGPGLLVIQEYWGLVGHITDVVDRFAAEGFVALAPDLYHGEQTKSPDEAGKLMMALNIEQTAKDLRGAAEYLLGRDDVTSDRLGVVGFCMGGQLALFAGQEYPDHIAAVVDFYGVHPKVQIDARRVRVPVLAHFAIRDDFTTPDVASELVERLRREGAEVEAHFYDADHAFFNDQRPQVYSEADAKVAWSRSLHFLRTHLAG